MNSFSSCNMIEELNNQVDLENDPRWMKVDEKISALTVMSKQLSSFYIIFKFLLCGRGM